MKLHSMLRKLFLYICMCTALFSFAAPLASAQVVEPVTPPSPTSPSPAASSGECTSGDCERLTSRLVLVINLLSALVGVAVIGSIIWGGIEYMAAADNPTKISGAKTRIRNALIALLMYFLLYGFMQWLVPGGVF